MPPGLRTVKEPCQCYFSRGLSWQCNCCMLLYGCDLLGFFGFYWQKAELCSAANCHGESGPAETRRVASVYSPVT